MKRSRVLLLSVLLMCATPAHASRIAFYRLGAAVVDPGSVRDPGRYGTGYGFNAALSVPFMHRLAIALDIAHDRLDWKSAGSSPFRWDDLKVTSVLLGADLAFRRGGTVRPLLSAGVGMARVDPGSGYGTTPFAGTSANPDFERRTVFASAVSAGVRIRLPGEHRAIRVQAGLLGLAREEFTAAVPIRIQFEF